MDYFRLRKRPRGGVLTEAQAMRLDEWMREHSHIANPELYHASRHELVGVRGLSGGEETTHYPIVVVGKVRYYAIPDHGGTYQLVPLPDPTTEREAELMRQGFAPLEAKVVALKEQGYTISDIALALGRSERTIRNTWERARGVV